MMQSDFCKKGGLCLKRFFAQLCAVLLVCGCFLTPRASADNSATKVEIYCTVNSDGDCLISMTVNLHLDGPDGGLMYPLPYGASDITMNGSSVATSRVGNVTLAAIGRAVGGMTGDFPVRFDYKLPKAVGVVKVGAERKLQLELPMICGFDYPIGNMSFIITMPEAVTTKPVFYSTYQQTSFESNLELVTNGNMITGSSKNTLNDHEAVTMTMIVPQSMFPGVSTYQREGNPEIIPMAIFAVLALIYWILFLRTLPLPYMRAAVPPEGITAGELNCRVMMSGGDLSMLVMSWAQMGYLLIHLDGSGRVLLQKQMEMGNERSLFEIRVYQALFRNRNIVDCTRPAYAKLCAKTAAMVPGERAMCKSKSGSRKIFRSLLCIAQVFCGICVTMNMTSIPVLQILFGLIFAIGSYFSAWMIQNFAFAIRARHKTKAWIALGICLLWVLLGAIAGQPWIPLVAVLVQLLCSYLVAYGGMRTEINRNEAGEILGLRRYLRKLEHKEAERLLATDYQYFFRLAPFAIALGVGKPFAAAFGRRKLDQCPYLITRVQGKRSAAEWMNLMLKAVEIMDDRYERTLRARWVPVRFRK